MYFFFIAVVLLLLLLLLFSSIKRGPCLETFHTDHLNGSQVITIQIITELARKP